MAETEITYEYIQQAANHPGVVKQLGAVAARIQARAKAIAASEKVTMEIWTEAGVRPQGRPFVNVLADNVAQEFGSRRDKRRRILGRAGEAG